VTIHFSKNILSIGNWMRIRLAFLKISQIIIFQYQFSLKIYIYRKIIKYIKQRKNRQILLQIRRNII